LIAMRAQRPDLLLLDLVMPEMDGFQVLAEMRRDPELDKIPVVLLTATNYAENALAQRANRIVIHRPDGLLPAQTLRCLRAVIGVLEPPLDDRLASEPGAKHNTIQRFSLKVEPVGDKPPGHLPD
jgi:CheY-like chemotaxis protein